MNFSDESKEDYFDGPDIPEAPEKPKKMTYTPDDPRYWEEPEDELDHLRPASPKRRVLYLWLGIAAAAVILITCLYVYLFSPKITTATQYGYVESIRKEGTVFKTYEGVILPYKSLMDTVRPYEGDFVFSVTDTKAAVRLKELQFHCSPVRVEYRVYRTVMPWRGTSKVLITRVDSVDERKILPPDRRPATVR